MLTDLGLFHGTDVNHVVYSWQFGLKRTETHISRSLSVVLGSEAFSALSKLIETELTEIQ